MDGYLRGYYGYKNFGDEVLFFGITKWILASYPLHHLYVEAGNKQWMEYWIHKNLSWMPHPERIHIVESKQHTFKLFTHLSNMLGCGAYRKMFKFFGGGEVLSDERPFPHDGWNIPLLFHASVRKKQFVLAGGIGHPRKWRTKLLYKILLSRAKHIVVRDATSYGIVASLGYAVDLHHDFSQEIILQAKHHVRPFHEPYILVNINRSMMNENNFTKITSFCHKHIQCKKIFFPCDMEDDVHCYETLKRLIPDLSFYDRTEKNIQESLDLFFYSEGGIGCRLHFLFPLKLYGKALEAIPYADKINKLILK